MACTFLGYSLRQIGYKCLSTIGRVYISRDVFFDEYVFPFAKPPIGTFPHPGQRPYKIIFLSHTNKFYMLLR